MTITAQIIADSISPEGIRLTTMQLRYPRWIHAEELTHRLLSTHPESIVYEAIPDGLMYDKNLSRNASSSRAIPVSRMIEDLRRDPAMPVYWGSHKPGMQAGEELAGEDLLYCKALWLQAMDLSINTATRMVEAGLHKQIANRILEPWAHINVVCTSTDWANFFALRAHADAQPEIKELALAMFNAMAGSQPTHLKPGEWHLPYVTEDERREAYFGPSQTPAWEQLKRISVARCARVSYLTHDGRPTSVEEDLELYNRLLGSAPLHASPAEHQATPDTLSYHPDLDTVQKAQAYLQDTTQVGFKQSWDNPELHGNLRGWIQYRKQLPNEFVPG